MTRRAVVLGCVAVGIFASAAWAEPAGIEVGGRVVLPWGEPLAGAAVELQPLLPTLARLRAQLDGETREPATRGTTDAGGRFRILAPHAGLWTVRVEAEGFAPLELDLQPLIEPLELPDARMENDAGMAVTVTSKEGTPIRGARVVVRAEGGRFAFLSGPEWSVPVRVAETGEDGKVSLPRGERERPAISVSHPRYVAEVRRGVAGTAARFELHTGVARKIDVRSAEGAPVAGVLLALGEPAHPVLASDERGGIEIVLDPKRPVESVLVARDGRRLATRLEPAAWEPDKPRVLALPDRLAVAGRLIDSATRRAIAGGLVWDAQNPVEGFVTDEAGGFVLTGSALARLELAAGAPGYLRSGRIEVQLVDDGRPGPTLALAPAAAIEGKVVDAEGQPVAGAVVDLEVQRPPSGDMRIEFGAPVRAPRAISGPSGAFRLSPVDPERSYLVRASAEGFAPASEPVQGLEPRVTRSGVRVRIERGRAVEGIVVGADDLPLRDVAVTLKPQRSRSMGMMEVMQAGAPSLEAAATTDGEGRFRIAGLPLGKFDLEAVRRGFAKKKVAGVEVGEDPTTEIGTIVLEPGLRVEGTVTDRDGVPLEGVAVRAAAGGPRMMMVLGEGAPDEPEPDALSDANGWFAVDDLSGAEPVTFRFNRVGFVEASAKGVALPRLEPLAIRMEPASDVSGVVVDGEGEPIAGASVRIERNHTLEMGGMVMQTVMVFGETADAEGRFLFDDQEPGAVSVSAVASGYREAKRDNVQVPKGEDVTGLELRLEAGAIVQGRVLQPDGRPAINAEVREVVPNGQLVRFGGTSTDGNGFYRIEGLVPGPVSLEAVHESWPRVVRDLELDPGIHTLDLRFEGGSDVSGIVLSTGGEPVADATVRLTPIGRFWAGGSEARTARDGTFEVPGVQDGDYELWAEAAEYAPSGGEPRVSVAGEPVAGLEVRLDPGVAVAGKITGLDPEELGHVSVRASGAAHFGWNAAPVDSRGNYRIEHLRPGEYDIVAQLADSGRTAKEHVVLEAGAGELRTDLKFDRGLTLSGRAVRAGEPLAGVMVMVEGIDVDRNGWGQTGERGGFAIEGLERGRYHVKLRDPEAGAVHDETIDLSTSREVELEVASASVSGRLRDASDRRALAGVALTLEPVNEELQGRLPAHTTTTDLEGRFNIPSIADGEWRLSAVKQGYAAVSRPVGVQHGRSVEGIDLTMEPTEGMTLEARLPSGVPADELRVAVLDGAGAPLVSGVYATGESGRVRLTTVPAGTWDLVVAAPGSATSNLQATAPGAAIPIALQPTTSLRVTIPDLEGSSLVATVVIRDERGAPFRALEWSGRPVSEFRMYGGRLDFSSLPPGTWAITASAADGRTWTGTSSTAGGTQQDLVLE